MSARMTDTDTTRLARSHRSLIGVNRSMTCPTTVAPAVRRPKADRMSWRSMPSPDFRVANFRYRACRPGNFPATAVVGCPRDAGAAILVAVSGKADVQPAGPGHGYNGDAAERGAAAAAGHRALQEDTPMLSRVDTVGRKRAMHEGNRKIRPGVRTPGRHEDRPVQLARDREVTLDDPLRAGHPAAERGSVLIYL